MKQLSCFVVVVLSFAGASCSRGPSVAQASIKTGFVNQSINQMDSNHWYVGAEAVFDAWGKSGGGIAYIPIPVGMKITHFQGTASWYTSGGCPGPVLASLVDRDPGNYSQPPVMYPIILNTAGPGVQLWFDYSTPLMVTYDGLRIEAYGIPKANNCTGDFEIQGVITVE